MLNINVAMRPRRVITSISKENQVSHPLLDYMWWMKIKREEKWCSTKKNDVFTPFRTKYVSNYLYAWNEKYIVFNEIISYTYAIDESNL